jgi:hypothetical protein
MMAKLIQALVAACLMCCTLGSPVAAEVFTSPDPSLACVFYTRREAREIFAEKRGHVAFCMNLDGWLTGAVLSKSGRVRCEIEGFINPFTGCGVMNWCELYFDIPCD